MIIANINFLIAIFILVTGLFIIISSNNLIKKLFGLLIFQASILLFYISLAKIYGGKPPILNCLDFKQCPEVYSNPLPHVLILTAIVVGLATLSVGLTLVIKIKENFGSSNENEIISKIREQEVIE